MAEMFRDLDPDGCQRLANGIIILAAKDYKKALRKHGKNPNNRAAKKQITEIEDFFHSAWYKVLTEADADTILDGLREEVNGNDE